ncbi:unnamed protein product [Spirodela intermedia]|uniref:Uncharacterized protein n=1 Tax=Spirodela intermedia TaxID=51605 RepID=A0A7I8JEM5_SPIIN|nr:unnamed protein product [Spirodela intermedia]CAA6668587.1 unnamed protein product [Spirodela intermedia]
MGSEVSRRILQSPKYLVNRAVKNPNKPAPLSAKSGKPYNPGCQTNYKCKR